MSPTMTAQQTLYLVDAHAYIHRAYHALPPLTTSKGEPVGALYGFARMLLLLMKREKPEFLAVCFDSPGPTFRHKAYAEYKATRKPIDDALKSQLAESRALVSALGLPVVEAPGYEADDLMATLAEKAIGSGFKAVLVSGDKDALQLVDDKVTVLNEAKGIFFDAAKVTEKFKVAPGQLVDYLALTGDTSDNVRGVPGIGAVGAAKLLNRFGSLEGLLQAAQSGHPDLPPKTARALMDSEKVVRLGRELITLDRNAPVKVEPRACRPDKPSGALIELLRRFEFHSLLRELAPESSSAPGPAPAPVKAVDVETRKLAPKVFLKAAVGARELSLEAARPAQGELLGPSGVVLTLGLPDGQTSSFSGSELKNAGKLLASGDVLKVGHDLKAVQALLRGEGLGLGGPKFDTMLAAYCLNPSRVKFDAASVLEERGVTSLCSLREVLEARLKENKVDKLYQDLELPLLDVLDDMEQLGFALDRPYLLGLEKEFASSISSMKREMDALAGVEINLNSPKQIAKLLFEDLKLESVRKTRKGGVSTDEETLRALAAKHPLPAKIIDYRELAKLKSTYIDSLLEKMDPETHRVHTHFNQTGTATGRLSSTEPNLQNIPIRTPLGQKIRRAFTAAKGLTLLSADYSQIDLRVLAHLSEDSMLCEAFRKGEDVHLKTACEVFGVPPEKVDKEMRRRAKAVNFGIVYGQGAHGLSAGLGISFGEAREYIARYFERYRGVQAWLKSNLEAARRDGCVRTLLGRIRYLPDINARNFVVRSFNERVAGNTPIQGTSADIIKAAMVNIHRKLGGPSGKWKARPILQVHDELIFELPKSEVKAFGAWVRREMEQAVRLSVPVVVDLRAGSNWQDMEALG